MHVPTYNQLYWMHKHNQELIDLRIKLDTLVTSLRYWETCTLDTHILDVECDECLMELSETCNSMTEWDMLKDDTTTNQLGA